VETVVIVVFGGEVVVVMIFEVAVVDADEKRVVDFDRELGNVEIDVNSKELVVADVDGDSEVSVDV
jgi:hypothetical protein